MKRNVFLILPILMPLVALSGCDLITSSDNKTLESVDIYNSSVSTSSEEKGLSLSMEEKTLLTVDEYNEVSCSFNLIVDSYEKNYKFNKIGQILEYQINHKNGTPISKYTNKCINTFNDLFYSFIYKDYRWSNDESMFTYNGSLSVDYEKREILYSNKDDVANMFGTIVYNNDFSEMMYDVKTNDWIQAYKMYITLDKELKKSTNIKYVYSEGFNNNYSENLKTYIFNDKGYLETYIDKYNNNSNYKYVFSYNSNNDVMEIIYYIGDNNEDYQESYKLVFEYDEIDMFWYYIDCFNSNHLFEYEDNIFNLGPDKMKVPSQVHSFTYDIKNKEWKKQSTYILERDVENNVITI